MARVEYTFTFTNALPGAAVSFGDHAVFSSATDTDPNGPSLQLDADSSIVVWSDAATLTARTVDGLGEEIKATATSGSPSVTSDEGTAGTSPFGSGTYGADEIDYDNTESSLTATDVQAALDELTARIATLEAP